MPPFEDDNASISGSYEEDEVPDVSNLFSEYEKSRKDFATPEEYREYIRGKLLEEEAAKGNSIAQYTVSSPEEIRELLDRMGDNESITVTIDLPKNDNE